MKSQPHTRLIVLSIILVVGLLGLGLTAGHVLHHMADASASATAPLDRHCAVASCSMSLPAWVMLTLLILAPIGRARLQALIPVASIALPRLDPPPRFAA